MGRVNAGKSSLVNSLVANKIIGVSKKPHTTRKKILGVLTEGKSQLIFLDTPGLIKFRNKSALDPHLLKQAWSALSEADVVCYLVDVERGLDEEDKKNLAKILKGCEAKLAVCLSKIDRKKKDFVARQADKVREETMAIMEEAKGPGVLIQPLPFLTSAKKPELRMELISFLSDHLPEGEWLFEEDEMTNLSQREVAAELIRESIFRNLGNELPYHADAEIEAFEEEVGLARIGATILVGRKQHKMMVIGKGGLKLKEIGTAARQGLERFLGKKVFLELNVKVDEKWMERWVEREIQTLKM
jgi:GTP-binding protein Era